MCAAPPAARAASGGAKQCWMATKTDGMVLEELHTQFAHRMVTKVVVAITWLPVGIVWDQSQGVWFTFDTKQS